MNRVINVRSRLLGEGRLSCRAGRATVKVEKTCSHDPALTRAHQAATRPSKPCRHLPLSAAVPSRAMTSPLSAPLRAIRQEALSRRPWASLFGSIEPVTFYQGAYA